jgi:hypothetical protein
MAIELTTATAAQLSGIQLYTSHIGVMDVFPNGRFTLGSTSGAYGVIHVSGVAGSSADMGDVVDFSHPDFTKFKTFSVFNSQASTLSAIVGGENLTALANVGTNSALILNYQSFSAATLNAFFTRLPATTRTATIMVNNNPGAATCTTSIATNKGYTVVTS